MDASQIWQGTCSEPSKIRLDIYLVQNFSEQSRSTLQQWISDGNVWVNQKKVLKPGTKIHLGDLLKVELPPPPQEEKPFAEDIPLDILYQDEYLAVLNKPPGMVIHRAEHCDAKTMVNALLHHIGTLSNIDPQRPGIVHRLDLETSGAILIAKTNETHLHLAQQFAARKIQKQYLALVRGHFPQETLFVDKPIGRNPKNPTRRCVLDYGKPSQTTFKRFTSFSEHTLLKAFPKTGRTHQIRVHLHFLGFPLVGEKIYGKDSEPLLSHHALHAEKLTFFHPNERKFLSFTAPLPQDFRELIEKLSARS
ncbi:MAG: RluA family pseudouridine synthase [Planctomycetota bacterium]